MDVFLQEQHNDQRSQLSLIPLASILRIIGWYISHKVAVASESDMSVDSPTTTNLPQDMAVTQNVQCFDVLEIAFHWSVDAYNTPNHSGIARNLWPAMSYTVDLFLQHKVQ